MLPSDPRLPRVEYRPVDKRTSRCAKLSWTCKELLSLSVRSSSQAALEAEGYGSLPFPFPHLMLLPRCLLLVSALTERKGNDSWLFLY